MLRQPVTITLYRRSLKNKTKELGKLIEKERTFRGKRPNWRTDLKKEIVSILTNSGGTTFTKIFEELKKLPKNLKPGSYETLSELLTELYNQGQVEKEPLHPYKWKATPIGALFQRAGEETEKRMKKLGPWKDRYPAVGEPREIDFEEYYKRRGISISPEIGKDFVEEAKGILHKTYPTPEEREKYFGDEKKFLKDIEKGAPALHAAWMSLIVYLSTDISRVLKLFLVVCGMERARAGRKLSPERIEQLCRLAEVWGTEKIKGDISRRIKEALEEVESV